MPTETKELNLLFLINAINYQGYAGKHELSRVSTVDEINHALLKADENILWNFKERKRRFI